MANNPTFTLTSSSALSDDYIWTADVLIDAASSSPVSVFTYNNDPQALFIRSDGVLCQIAPANGQSSAAWSVTAVTASAGVTQTVAGVQSDGTVHGFYTDSENTYHIALGAGGWSSPDTLPLCAQLSIVTNGLTGELVAYGLDSNGHLLLMRETNGAWASTALTNSPSFTGSRPVLMLTDESSDWVMAVPGSASSGGYLDLYQGSATAVLSGPTHVPIANPVKEVIYGYWNNNSALFLFIDSQNNFYTNAGNTTNVAQIPNMSVAQAAAIVDYSSNLHIYAADSSGNLSVLHQTGWDYTNNTPTWAPMIPLDKGLQALFADSSPMDTAAFFAVDGNAALWRYSQNTDSETGNNVWSTQKAQMPNDAPESYRIAQFRTEITVTDQNGNPAPNLQLSVSASTNSSILVKGVSYSVGPSQTATITTGATGKAHLSTIAYDLVASRLTFTAPGLTTTGAINPASTIQSYLTGSGTLNGGTSQQRPVFSGTTIQGAQVDNAPLAPLTQDPSNGLTLATAACSGIQSIFQIPTVSNFVGSPGARHAGFALDLSNRQKPIFRTFATEDEYQGFRREHGFAGDDKALLGSWWDDIEDFAEDLWHGIRRAAISIVKFTVHTADAAIDLAVKVGNDIHNITGAAIQGIESAISAVQGIFAWIGAEIDKIIEWLKMLFDWKDILDTAKALEAALSGSFGYLQGAIQQYGQPLVNGFFSQLQGLVTSSFSTVRAQFTSGETLASLVPLPGSSRAVARRKKSTAQALAISPEDFLSWSGNVQNNWLVEKIESFIGMGPNWNMVASLTPILETLETCFNTVVADFEAAATDFANTIVTVIKEPSQFASYAVADFLSAVESLCLAALAFLDGIIEVFMQAVSAAIAAADNILTAPLEIPFLTGLWNMLGDLFGLDMPSFTVSGVFCMALAIPVTLLYKIVNGGDTEPFPGGALPSSDTSKQPRLGESNAALAMQYTAAALTAISTLFDTALDAVPEVTLVFFKIIDILAPTLIQIFTWPTGIPFQPVPMSTNQERANFANWVIGFGVIALDLAVLLSTVKWNPDSNVGKKIDPIGKLITTAIGGINMASGVIAGAFGADIATIASNIIGPLPDTMQFLTLDSVNDSLEGVPLAIKLVIDFFAGEGEALTIAVG